MKSFPTRSALALTMLWVAHLGMLSPLLAQDGDEPQTVSARRVAVLRRLARERLAEAGPAADEGKLEKAILGQFSIAEPDCPTGVIATPVRGDETVETGTKQIVAGLVAKRFPPLDEAKLKAEAEAKYTIHKRGEHVKFYYATNPQIIREVRGAYRGRTTAAIQVGSKVVLVEDIARVNGNAALLLRFDPEASEELRQTYVREKLEARDAAMGTYERQATQLTWAKQRQLANQANENEGYLFVDGAWTTAATLVGSLVAAERERLAQEARQEAARLIARKRARIAVAADAQASHEARIATVAHTDVNAEYAAYKERAAAAAAFTPATDTAEEPVVPEGSGTAGEDPEVAESATDGSAESAPEVAAPSSKILPTWAYAALGGVAVLIVVILVLKGRSTGSGKDLKKFFQGRGKVQRTFWELAEEKPDTFNYVAYRYPTEQDARQALLQLSYVNERAEGDLVCRHDVYFGFGPHQDKFVAFVGGETLHYALWREASAAFPEYPNAEYFRVSTAPDVNLEIPNLDTLLADAELQIEHVENREGEGTDYSQYYIYKAPGKENALEFLKHAQIQEAGLHVIVLTKVGVFGKDENGIYEETMELWTERYPDFFAS